MRDLDDEDDDKTPPASNEAYWFATTLPLHEFLKKPKRYDDIVVWALYDHFRTQFALRHALAWLSFKDLVMCDEEARWRRNTRVAPPQERRSLTLYPQNTIRLPHQFGTDD